MEKFTKVSSAIVSEMEKKEAAFFLFQSMKHNSSSLQSSPFLPFVARSFFLKH